MSVGWYFGGYLGCRGLRVFLVPSCACDVIAWWVGDVVVDDGVGVEEPDDDAGELGKADVDGVGSESESDSGSESQL